MMEHCVCDMWILCVFSVCDKKNGINLWGMEANEDDTIRPLKILSNIYKNAILPKIKLT